MRPGAAAGTLPEAKKLLLSDSGGLKKAVASANKARIDSVLAKPVREAEVRLAIGKLWKTRQLEIEGERLHAENERITAVLGKLNTT